MSVPDVWDRVVVRDILLQHPREGVLGEYQSRDGGGCLYRHNRVRMKDTIKLFVKVQIRTLGTTVQQQSITNTRTFITLATVTAISATLPGIATLPA